MSSGGLRPMVRWSELAVVALLTACGSHGGSAGMPDAMDTPDAPPDAAVAHCTQIGFPSLPAPSLGDFAIAVAVADVNVDGKPDLVAANGAGIRVLLGNGDRTFRPSIDTPLAERVVMFD